MSMEKSVTLATIQMSSSNSELYLAPQYKVGIKIDHAVEEDNYMFSNILHVLYIETNATAYSPQRSNTELEKVFSPAVNASSIWKLTKNF